MLHYHRITVSLFEELKEQVVEVMAWEFEFMKNFSFHL